MRRCRLPLFLIPVAILVGCASLERDAKDAVIDTLPDPYGVTFDGLKRYPGQVLCGNFDSTDMSGFRRKRERFIYTADTLYRRPTDRQWSLFCTDTPALALYEETGIGPWGPEQTELLQVYEHLDSFRAAIERFRQDTGDVPLGKGLRALAPPEGDYLETLPTDPWGRPYEYEIGLGGRTVRGYVLRTLGADGAPGGTGPDADIGKEHLPYLDRLDRL